MSVKELIDELIDIPLDEWSQVYTKTGRDLCHKSGVRIRLEDGWNVITIANKKHDNYIYIGESNTSYDRIYARVIAIKERAAQAENDAAAGALLEMLKG